MIARKGGSHYPAKQVLDEDLQIGRRIRQWRITRGMSQTELGERIGVSFQQLQKYERGANRISGGRLQLIAEALEIAVATLLATNDHNAGIGPLAEQGQSRAGVRLAIAFTKIADNEKRDIIARIAEMLAGGGVP